MIGRTVLLINSVYENNHQNADKRILVVIIYYSFFCVEFTEQTNSNSSLILTETP